MKELFEFKNWLKEIAEKKLEDESHKFVWELMKSPYVEFHYELLKDGNISESFRQILSSRFDEHGVEGEDFLISKLDSNQDIEFQATIIFLLGKINKKHKSKILDYARKFTESENDDKRDRAIIVLGWIGTIKDVEIFGQHLLEDENSKCRAWSASSFMQMWFKNESETIKKKAFESYKLALTKESDPFVISVMLSAIRVMGKIKLGISQTSLDELDFEKIEFSKIKAIRFLDKYLKQQS